MNLCKNCKHVIASSYSGICKRPNRFTGFPISISCNIERIFSDANSCGREGKFFEPKPIKRSWLSRLLRK